MMLGAGAPGACAAPPAPGSGGSAFGQVPAPVREVSGLAVSRRDSRIYWAHEDSYTSPVLHAFEADGRARGSLRVAGAENIDWEDVASFTLDGRAWLLIADVGDNQGVRTNCSLLVVAEPDPAELSPDRELVATVAWRVPVSYADGPRDCEAVAVDAREGRVYLLAKRVTPHGLYVLPLREASGGAPVGPAERVGELTGFPAAEGSRRMLPVPSGAYRAQPTGMDFAADGSAAVITTYGEVLLYPKNDDESWARALSRPGRVLASHGLYQAAGGGRGARRPRDDGPRGWRFRVDRDRRGAVGGAGWGLG